MDSGFRFQFYQTYPKSMVMEKYLSSFLVKPNIDAKCRNFFLLFFWVSHFFVWAHKLNLYSNIF